MTQQRIKLLMAQWAPENKLALYNKMQKLGIQQGGILSTLDENLELFNYLAKDLT